MKKIFTLIAVLATAMSSLAADYKSQMSISLNGTKPTTQEATVSAVRSEEGDNIYYEIVLKQFSFMGQVIGDVTISGIEADDSEGMGGYSFLHETTKEAAITNGGAIATALGGKVTVTIKDGSCINNDNLYLDIALPVNIMETTINVTATFGTNPTWTRNYTDNLSVTAMGQTSPAQQATINVTKQYNGKYTLSLKNFSIYIPSTSGEEGAKGETMYVGTVVVNDVDGVENADGSVNLSAKQTVTIQDGDDPNIEWSFADIPVDVELTANMTESKLKADMKIIYTMFPGYSMDIDVKFGYETTGINKPVVTGGKEMIYDISGNRLDSMKKGINIIRKADGSTVKVLKK